MNEQQIASLMDEATEKLREVREERERFRAEVRAVSKEMRDHRLARGGTPSMRLWGWADRLDRALGDKR